jgi:hypothetical protein
MGLLGSEQNGKVVNVNDATIQRMQRDDAEIISAAFSAIGWNKPVSLYQRYLAEQDDGTRIGYVATVAEQFAGYVTLLWNSKYRPFAVRGIPEISDLNVLPVFRRQGVEAVPACARQ